MYPVRPRMLLARCVDVFREDLFICRLVLKRSFNAVGMPSFI